MSYTSNDSSAEQLNEEQEIFETQSTFIASFKAE
jgi:hypothetical protein